MATIVEKIVEDILELPAKDRAALAHQLIQSLDDDAADSDVEEAWVEEIARRSADIRSGNVTCRPVDDVIADVRRKLRHARAQSS